MKALQLLDNLIVKLETNLGLPHRYAAAAPPQQVVTPPPPAPVAAEEVKVAPKREPKQKKQKAPKAKAAPKAAAPEEAKDDEKQLFYNLDLRVGKFIEVWKHPESDKLYCEKIDIAEEEPRSIASGLQQHIPLDQMSGMCIVLANLKARKLAGFPSNGMVLCAHAGDSGLEVVRPPEGAIVGERVMLEGDEAPGVSPLLPKLNPKHKKWEKAAPSFKSTADGFAAFSGYKWSTTAGLIATESKDAVIS